MFSVYKAADAHVRSVHTLSNVHTRHFLTRRFENIPAQSTAVLYCSSSLLYSFYYLSFLLLPF